jgi:hypothetical protein
MAGRHRRLAKEQKTLLAELERALGAHAAALEKHAETLGTHEGEIGYHEHFIAECEKTARREPALEEGLAEAHAKRPPSTRASGMLTNDSRNTTTKPWRKPKSLWRP